MLDTHEFIHLDEADLDGLAVTATEVIGALETLFRRQDESRAWAVPKSAFQLPDGRYLMATLAAADDPPLVAVKSLVLNPRNAARGLRQINALVTLLDSDTGLPVAVIDGGWITAIRTAGLSALAARHLANPESTRMALIGCGVQALSHLKIFSSLFPLREIRAFGRGAENRDALCEVAEGMGLRAIRSAAGRDAMEGAELIVTSVTLTTDVPPFLDARGLARGSFTAVTDYMAPWRKETASAFDRVVVDDVAHETASDHPLIDPERINGDLRTLLRGEIADGYAPAIRTAFVFRGPAIADLALAGLVYRKAKATSVGRPIQSRRKRPTQPS